MSRLLLFGLGGAIGFLTAIATISAAALLGIGVVAHLLVRQSASIASVISFDPSSVAARAPYPGAIAFILFSAFWTLYGLLSYTDRRRSQRWASQRSAARSAEQTTTGMQ